MSNDLGRRSNTRKQRNIFVIVCEGEKTEINYFHGFNERYSPIRIEALHGSCTDPKNIILHARKMKRRYDIDFDYGDRIWCVFDVNSNEDHVLNTVDELSEKYGIPIALSNPCFELWFILHYVYLSHAITSGEALDRLKEHISGYEKSMDIFDIIENKIEIAIERAKRLNRKHIEAGRKLFSAESNPSTQAFKIVEEIFEMKRVSRGG